MSFKNRSFVLYAKVTALGILNYFTREEITKGRDPVITLKGTPAEDAETVAGKLADLVTLNTFMPVLEAREDLTSEIEAGLESLITSADTLNSVISLKVSMNKSNTDPTMSVLSFTYRAKGSPVKQYVELPIEA